MKNAFVYAILLMTWVPGVGFADSSGTDTPESPIRVGVIGLDTSHVISFTKLFNQEPAIPEMRGCRVVAAYPYGSRTIESSYSRIPKYTEQVQEMGVDVVDSLDELLSRVDCVLLETNDGKPHLSQALEVFRAGIPVFIDKPVAHDLAHTVAIYRAAKHYNVPMFSSSSLRYGPNVQAVRGGSIGEVVGCDTYSPCSLEPSHVDLYWYGIHGVELLYTAMGKGCQSVRQTATPDCDLVVGDWGNSRVGTFRGMRAGKRGYGGTAYGEKATAELGPYAGYQPLLERIAEFFHTGQPPIDPAETVELYAFMQAAQVSKETDGGLVKIADVMADAERQADELLEGELD